MTVRERGMALEGKGYGTRRRMLYESARDQIERSIQSGFYGEATALCESILADRLESRLSFLQNKNCGFQTLGKLVEALRSVEKGDETQPLRNTIAAVEVWRKLRNRALHEMVKVVADGPVADWQDRPTDWEVRTDFLQRIASLGYELAQHLYLRVAELNPKHHDRVLPSPNRAIDVVRAELDSLKGEVDDGF